MALWLFPSPQVVRLQRALGAQPVLSLWTRVHRDVPSTILRQADNATWEEWPGTWPGYENPGVKYLFSGRGFNTMGSDQSVFSPASRLYIGGHQYVIDDTLANELQAAVTSYAPSGYGAYITAAPGGSVFTGDEVILSGYTSESPRKTTSA